MEELIGTRCTGPSACDMSSSGRARWGDVKPTASPIRIYAHRHQIAISCCNKHGPSSAICTSLQRD